MLNPVLNEAVMNFRRAYKKSKAPIWLRLQEMMERSSSIEVNLDRLSKYTEHGDVVVVPGKVLGSGSIDHKITLCAYAFSQTAAKRITDAGGNIITIENFVQKFPEGSKVKIIG